MMLALLVFLNILLFLVAYPFLPASLSGIIAFGGSALLAPWIYSLISLWAYHQPAQKPCELLALKIEPLKQYIQRLRLPRLLLYVLLVISIYIFLSWVNEELVAIWSEKLGGTWIRSWSNQAKETQSVLLQSYSIGQLLIIVGVLTPIAEELFFRGAIMGWMLQKKLLSVECHLIACSTLYNYACQSSGDASHLFPSIATGVFAMG